MQKVIEIHKEFYESLNKGNKVHIKREIENQGISILTGFIDNINLISNFYGTFYSKTTKRVVLCGINPGRFGAGITGIPFLDFKSVSTFLPGVDDCDEELSAQFIFSIIKEIGQDIFFNNVYLTNISWLGFVKDGKNFNYYDLDQKLQEEFTNGFIEEMKIVQPKIIIPLSKEVQKSLKKMKSEKKLDYTIGKRINHPYYYSNFPSRRETGLNEYVETIKGHIL